jgi:hypothetical protein
MPATGLVCGGLTRVVGVAQSASVPGVVRVEVAVNQFSAGQWPVVSVGAAVGASVGPLAERVTGKDAGTEGLAVVVAVASLGCCAASLFGAAATLGAAALVDDLGTAGCGAWLPRCRHQSVG